MSVPLKYLNQYFTTKLNVGGGLDASQTTGIILLDVSGLDTTKPGIALLTYADPLDTTKAEWISYTSINGSKEFVGVTRDVGGYGAHTHLDQAVVAFPISKQHINDINDKLTGVDTGVITDDQEFHGTPTFDAEALSIFYPGSMSRQAIMNGNFDVWQRGTSVSVTDAAIIRVADRWFDYNNKDSGTLPTLTRSRQLLTSGDITNAFYYTRLATNGAGTSLGVNSQGGFFQRIEHGTRNLCGLNKTVTVSFWARSDIANKRICPSLQQYYGTTGSPSSAEYILGTPITLTSTWTKYTATFTTNTLVGKTFGTDNNDYLQVNLFYMWGTTLGGQQVYTSATAETFVGSGNVDIAQVQLCAGDVALPFQPKSYEEELRACQRYYEKSFNYSVAPADAASVLGVEKFVPQSTSSYHNFPTTRYRVTKRITVTPTLYNPVASDANKIRNTADNTNIPGSVGNAGDSAFTIFVNNSSVAATKELVTHWTAEAEL